MSGSHQGVGHHEARSIGPRRRLRRGSGRAMSGLPRRGHPSGDPLPANLPAAAELREHCRRRQACDLLLRVAAQGLVCGRRGRPRKRADRATRQVRTTRLLRPGQRLCPIAPVRRRGACQPLPSKSRSRLPSRSSSPGCRSRRPWRTLTRTRSGILEFLYRLPSRVQWIHDVNYNRAFEGHRAIPRLLRLFRTTPWRAAAQPPGQEMNFTNA